MEAIEFLNFQKQSFSGDLYLSHLPSTENSRQNFAVLIVDQTQRLQQKQELENAHSLLRESEASYRLLVEYGSDMVFVLSNLGDIRYMSPNWERVTGHRLDACIDGDFFRFTHADDFAAIKIFFDEVMGGAIPEELELRIRHRDGSYRWLALVGRLVNHLHGEKVFLGQARLIDSRKQAEEQLLKQSEILRKRMNELQAIYAISELAKTETNPEKFFLKTLEIIPTAMFHPRDVCVEIELSGRRFQNQSVAGSQVHHLESKLLSNDHLIGKICVQFCGLYNVEKHSMLFKEEQSFIDEIALLASRYMELHNSKEKLRLASELFERSHEGLIITDAEQRIISVNNAFYEMTGYSPEEIIGKKPSILSSGQHDDIFYHQMWNEIHSLGAWHGEIWNRRKNGEVYPQMLSITRVTDENLGATGYIGIMLDIADLRQAEDHINRLSQHDPLTGLPNRTLLRDRLCHAILLGNREHFKTGVMYMDLDHFKYVNDTLGHPVGDELLQEMAERIKAYVRESDTVSRLGGDEFVVLLPDVGTADDIAGIAEKILAALSRPFSTQLYNITPSASIGICLHPDDGDDFDALLQKADIALYQAKEYGRNRYKFFTEEMNQQVQKRMRLETALREAIQKQEFFLVYQPQIELRSDKIMGVEALIRWNHPELGAVSPTDFIPLAEETGLIIDIGHLVLRMAFRQQKFWQTRGHDLTLAVNISSVQFKLNNIYKTVLNELEDAGVTAEKIDLELTESLLISDQGDAHETIRLFNRRGFKVAIDDFGTGYSNLSYLMNLAVNKLKIDQSFIRKIPGDNDTETIVRAIVNMAHQLGMQCIAEGIETEAQLEFIKRIDCDQGQGFFLGRPMLPEQIDTLLTSEFK
ncbi:MAG: sensor domain-containing protein [Methylobacter sp.]